MKDCIFCKIANKEIPTKFLFESDDIVAFNDIHPVAKVHILIIPKKHISSTDHLEDSDTLLMENLVQAAKQIAREQNINEDGYRLIFNTKNHGGQEIDHIHLHLIGGEKLGPMNKK